MTQGIQAYDFSTVFQSTKTYIDTYNEKQKETKAKLNSNHRATAEWIIRLYLKQLNNAITLGDHTEDMQGFRTYNTSLSSCKGCTTRTILNHKTRLKAAGFITKEINHGNTGIELWINEAVIKPQNTPITEQKTSEKPVLKINPLESKAKNFRTLVHEQQEQINNNSNVDKCITREKEAPACSLGATDKNDRNIGMNIRKRRALKTETQKKQTRGRAKISENRTEDPKNDTKTLRNGIETAFLIELVQRFWQYTKGVLYPDLELSQPEIISIQRLIWVSVFHGFKKHTTINDLKKNQEILYKRVDMVHRWRSRNANRWIPSPDVYFSPENTRNGFNTTYDWYLKNELLKQQIKREIIIQKAEQEWKDHEKGKGKHKHKSRLQLFEIQKKRMAALKDEKLMYAYQKSIEKTILKQFS